MLSHGQLDFVGITQGQTTFFFSFPEKTWSVPYFSLNPGRITPVGKALAEPAQYLRALLYLA